MRLVNSTTKKNIWNVKVVVEGFEKINKDFATVKEIADELGMSYAQVSDLKNGRTKNLQSRFKFYPVITITRIGKTQKQFYDERRALKQLSKEIPISS